MKASIRITLPAVVLTVLALGACSRDEGLRCRAGTNYLGADSAAPIRVPDDLNVPDESEALQIPGSVAPRDESAVDGCLEYSPAFSADIPEDD